MALSYRLQTDILVSGDSLDEFDGTPIPAEWQYKLDEARKLVANAERVQAILLLAKHAPNAARTVTLINGLLRDIWGEE